MSAVLAGDGDNEILVNGSFLPLASEPASRWLSSPAAAVKPSACWMPVGVGTVTFAIVAA